MSVDVDLVTKETVLLAPVSHILFSYNFSVYFLCLLNDTGYASDVFLGSARRFRQTLVSSSNFTIIYLAMFY